MQTHGNLTASYLWQPGELARRILGERPAPVPPTRELWPPVGPPVLPFSISTLHVAYLEEEPPPRRSATLPPRAYEQAPQLPEYIVNRPRFCTIGTNTEQPPTVLDRVRMFFKMRKKDECPIETPPAGRLTAVTRDATIETIEDNENIARRAFNGFKKAFTVSKYRIAPDTETVDSPKIVYAIAKPGDRMTNAFGTLKTRNRCKLPSRSSCTRHIRSMGTWCKSDPRPQRPPRRNSQPTRLQITQV